MIERVEVVAHGRPASEALAAAVARAQADGPLSPVTVVVPSHLAGLAARRALGTGRVGPGGIANVAFVTPAELAGLLSADLPLGTRPLSNPVLGAAVRRSLAEDPGPFAAVADHAATEAALAGLYAELSAVSEAARRSIAAGGPEAAAAVARYRSIRRHLAGFHDESDLAGAAATRPDLAAALVPLGTLIWFLPAPCPSPVADLLAAALAAAPRAEVLVGVTGDEGADALLGPTLARAGVVVAGAPSPPPPTADRIRSATDADDEVRAVVRDVVALVAEGVSLDRIGIFYPVADPYLPILEQQLQAADLPATGPAPRPVAASVAGRTLLGALALPEERWRRDRVLKVVSGGPVRLGGGLVSAPRWEVLSRAAGVVGGLDDWQDKLVRHAQAIGAALDAAAEGGPARSWLRGRPRDLDDLDELRRFVAELAAAVGAVDAAPTWAAKAEAGRSLLHHLLGPGGRHRWWPEVEQEAFERVEDALARLAGLDELEPAPAHHVFVRALGAELARPLGRRGRYGLGLTYGPLESAPGQDLDAVFVVGCVEGLCPAPRREDSLLADAARERSGGELAPRAVRLDAQHHAFLAALAAAPPGRRTLTLPRGDLRSSRRPLPSRWLLDSASALVGHPVYATDVDRLPAEVVDAVASFASGLQRDDRPAASLDERDLAELLAHRRAAGPAADPVALATHPVGALVQRGLLAQAARRSPALTEWDGNLAGLPVPSTADVPMSPTRLETWAQCGFRYLLGYLLGLRERDDPEQLVELSALDRGSAVHTVLERFVEDALRTGVPAPDEPWDPAARLRIQGIADGVFAELEAQGRTGRALNWRMRRRDLRVLLDHVLEQDDEHRRARRARPDQVELPFGLDDRPPVELVLDDGRTLRFRGLVDRVDRTESGGAVVIDYKSGRPDKYRELAADPVRAGLTLQLGLYAEAARAQLGVDDVAAEYWLVEQSGASVHLGYEWTADRRRRFLDVVTAIVDGIEAGSFPMVPGEWDPFFGRHTGCRWCDFDAVCPQARAEQAEVKLAAPAVRRREALAPPEPEPVR